MSLPIILKPGEGESVKIGTSTCTFKVTGKDTHGHFGLFEFTLEPETEGASPHIHLHPSSFNDSATTMRSRP